MVRYMDDVLFFHNDKEELKMLATEFETFLSEALRLQLHPSVLNRTAMGIPYLGYVIYKNRIRLNQRSRKRFKRKVAELDEAWQTGRMDEHECVERMQAAIAFIHKADARNFCKKLFA